MSTTPEKQPGSPVPEKESEKGSGLKHAEAGLADIRTSSAAVSNETLLSADDLGGDELYLAKIRLMNQALAEGGFGWYQTKLFCLTGLGYAADNAFPVLTSLILTPIAFEFGPPSPAYLPLAQNLGLLVGAFVFSLSSDIFGRKFIFNLTLGVAGVFVLVAGSAPNFVAAAFFAALWSVGVGGNIAVDSACFIEVCPPSHQWLLTVLTGWWAAGQILVTGIAWALIPPHSCASPDECPRSSNEGWRYLCFTMGAIFVAFWALRFFAMNFYESPKYLIGKGQDEEALVNWQAICKVNKQESRLTLEHFRALDAQYGVDPDARKAEIDRKKSVKEHFGKFNLEHIKGLFVTRKMAWATTVLLIVWAIIGLAFPLYNAFLPYYLRTRVTDGDSSTYRAYRDSLIIAVVGFPASIIGGLLVRLPKLGRRGTLAISTVLTGVFILCSTTSKTSNALLGWNCGYSFTSGILYAVLYGLAPEIFPSKHRGTGNGLVATANRVFGVLAPAIVISGGITTSVPIWIAGALFIAGGLFSLLLPFDPVGKASV